MRKKMSKIKINMYYLFSWKLKQSYIMFHIFSKTFRISNVTTSLNSNRAAASRRCTILQFHLFFVIATRKKVIP